MMIQPVQREQASAEKSFRGRRRKKQRRSLNSHRVPQFETLESRTLLSSVPMNLSLLKDRAFDLSNTAFEPVEIVAVPILDYPPDSELGSVGLVFQEKDAITTQNVLDQNGVYVKPHVRASNNKMPMDVYTDANLDGHFEEKTYDDAAPDYSASIIQPPVDPAEIPAEGQVISQLSVGAPQPGNGYPQFLTIGAEGYGRFNGYTPQTVGSSFRVAASNIFRLDGGDEQFPRFREMYATVLDSSSVELLGLVDSEPFTGAVSMTIRPGQSTIVDVDATWYPRRDVLVANEPGTAFLAYSSMFWKDEFTTPLNSSDEAHDIDTLVIGFDTSGDEKPETVVTASLHIPPHKGDVTVTRFEDHYAGTPVFVALDNRDQNPAHYEAYATADYASRASYAFEILQSDVALGLHLFEQHTASEYHDNIVVAAAILEDIHPAATVADGIQVVSRHYAYTPDDSNSDGLTNLLESLLEGQQVQQIQHVGEIETLNVPSQYATIQAAIAAATPGDTIAVAAGVYTENIVVAKNHLSIIGAGAGRTVLQAPEQSTVPVVQFVGVDRSVVFDGFTIRDGNSYDELQGGGIHIHNASPIIQDNEITENLSRTLGGGISIRGSDSDPLIRRNHIHHNSTRRTTGSWGGFGGGIFIGDGARGEIRDNQINNNSAWAYGGAIYSGSVMASGYTLVTGGGSSIIQGNIITANSADFVSGVSISSVLEGSQLILENNVLTNTGSAINVVQSDVRIVNNVLYDNRGGTAININGDKPADVRNNIVVFNGAYGICGPTAVLEYNNVFGHTVADYCDGTTPGVGSISEDPKFADPENGDFRLLPGSPSIDAGDPAAQYSDLDGTRNDMGAFGGPHSNVVSVVDVVVMDTLLTDVDTGAGKTFAVSVDFSAAVDQTVHPTITFGADVSSTLTLSAGASSWLDSDTYQAVYVVADANVDIRDITIDVTGAKDLAGNSQQDYMPEAEFDVDTQNPAVPIITGITDDTGAAGDGTTNDTTLAVLGTAEAGSSVQVFNGGTAIGSATTDDNGVWSLDYSGTTLAEGAYAFTATAGDAAGNVSVESTAFNVTVDTTAPVVTVIPLATTDGTPLIRGTVSDGSLAVLVSGKTYMAGDGHLTVTGTAWALQIPGADALAAGTYEVAASAADAAGNAGSDASKDELVIESMPDLAVTSLMPTSTGFVIQFNRQIVADVLNLYSGQGTALGSPDVVVRASDGGNVAGSLIVGSGLQQVTFVKTGGTLATGTYAITLRSATDGFKDSEGGLLYGTDNGTAVGDYVNSLTVTAPLAGTVTVSVPDITRGPGQSMNVPASASTGIPLRLTDGANVQSVDMLVRFDPALLDITGATVGAGMPANSGVTFNSESPGVLRLGFWSPTPLPAGETLFANLQATVRETAGYTSKQVLDLDEISINEGNIIGVDDDAVHVVGFFGDATSNGTYSSLDTSRISRVVVGLDTGFSAYPLADPVLVGDITGDGRLSSLDTSRISRVAVGLPVTEVPQLPSPAVTIVPSGPDPKLSISKDLVVAPGATVDLPIDIDSIVNLAGNELFAADLVVLFDSAILTINSVSLGEVPAASPGAGWNFPTANIDNTQGRLVIGLSNQQGLGGTFEGSLLKVNVTVNATAAPGPTAINLAASSGAQVTMLNEGELTLIPAPTNAADDAIDGVILVGASRHRYDVNGDGQVTPEDPLVLINEINHRASTGASNQVLPAGPTDIWWDLNGDDFLTAYDVLAVVNFLNDHMFASGEGEAIKTPRGSAFREPVWATGMRERHYSADQSHLATGLVDSLGGSSARQLGLDQPAFPKPASNLQKPFSVQESQNTDIDRFWGEELTESSDPNQSPLDDILSEIVADVETGWGIKLCQSTRLGVPSGMSCPTNPCHVFPASFGCTLPARVFPSLSDYPYLHD